MEIVVLAEGALGVDDVDGTMLLLGLRIPRDVAGGAGWK